MTFDCSMFAHFVPRTSGTRLVFASDQADCSVSWEDNVQRRILAPKMRPRSVAIELIWSTRLMERKEIADPEGKGLRRGWGSHRP